MTYHLSIRYEPGVKRLGGRKRGGHKLRHKRGAWRVTHCSAIGPLGVFVSSPYVMNNLLQMVSATPIRPGSFCDPRKVLEGWQRGRRA